MDSNLEYIYEHYVEPSDKDNCTDGTVMMQAILEDAEHAEEHVPNFNGLIKGHRVLNRNRVREHLTLMTDYFAPDTLFDDHFRRHFRMRKTFFNRLYHCVWMLAYCTTADLWDEYLRMSESTCGDTMVGFATVEVKVFGPQYLREPTVTDTERFLAISEAIGWVGLLETLWEVMTCCAIMLNMIIEDEGEVLSQL
nr:uncharacterized protein LOC109744861 [Aegilops tauschii subsp. strangulata]